METPKKTVKEILVEGLKLTEKEFDVLASYAYADHFGMAGRETIPEFQNFLREAMMEDEGLEAELGESVWQGNDKNILINIMNR